LALEEQVEETLGAAFHSGSGNELVSLGVGLLQHRFDWLEILRHIDGRYGQVGHLVLSVVTFLEQLEPGRVHKETISERFWFNMGQVYDCIHYLTNLLVDEEVIISQAGQWGWVRDD